MKISEICVDFFLEKRQFRNLFQSSFTTAAQLWDLADVYYDILPFFSPTGIKSLLQTFPDFEQNNTRIAVFGNTTQKEALEHGLRIDILAPTPETPSMTMALEKYIAEANKGK